MEYNPILWPSRIITKGEMLFALTSLADRIKRAHSKCSREDLVALAKMNRDMDAVEKDIADQVDTLMASRYFSFNAAHIKEAI